MNKCLLMSCMGYLETAGEQIVLCMTMNIIARLEILSLFAVSENMT
jgi:hypothetical protein